MRKDIHPLFQDKHSCSSATRFYNCPGSLRLCNQEPALPDTNESTFGTEVHAIVANNFLYKPKWLPKMSDEVNDFATNATFQINELAYPIGSNWPDEHCVLVETRLYCFFNPKQGLVSVTPHEIHFIETDIALFHGQPDLAFYCRDAKTVHVIDLKTGRNQVEAEGNLQLIEYAYLAAKYFQGYLGVEVEKAMLTIVQPMCGKPRSITLDFFEIEDYVNEMISDRIRTNSQQLNAGQWCQYCNAKFVCSEYLNKFSQLEIKSQIPATSNKAEVKEKILNTTTKQRRLLVEYAKAIKRQADQVLEQAKSLSKEGVDFDGLAIKETPYGHKFADTEIAWQVAMTLGFTLSEFLSYCKVSLPQIKNAYAEKNGLTGKAKDTRFMQDFEFAIVPETREEWTENEKKKDS